MSIYDRSTWPAPAANPMVILFERGDAWYSNAEILAALGYPPKRSLISQWPTLLEQIGEDGTAIAARGWLAPGEGRQPQGGGQERLYSRKALVFIAMRAQTSIAASFCDYLAEDLASPDLDSLGR